MASRLLASVQRLSPLCMQCCLCALANARKAFVFSIDAMASASHELLSSRIASVLRSRFKLGRRAPAGRVGAATGCATNQEHLPIEACHARKTGHASGRKTLECGQLGRGLVRGAAGRKGRAVDAAASLQPLSAWCCTGACCPAAGGNAPSNHPQRRRLAARTAFKCCGVRQSKFCGARQIMAAYERQGGFDGYAARASRRGYAARRASTAPRATKPRQATRRTTAGASATDCTN